VSFTGHYWVRPRFSTSASASPGTSEMPRSPRTCADRRRGASRSSAPSASNTWDIRGLRRRTFPDTPASGAFFLLSYPYQPTFNRS